MIPKDLTHKMSHVTVGSQAQLFDARDGLLHDLNTHCSSQKWDPGPTGKLGFLGHQGTLQ